MVFKNAIVLTGGIATGKSSVAKFFMKDDFFLIDADKIAHGMLTIHYQKISDLFGEKYVENGVVNRKQLGQLIFSNKEEKKRLESLLHPLIFNEIERQAKELDLKEEPYIVDIPLFFESKNRYPMEKIIVVYTSKKKQLERLMLRDNFKKDEAQQRINSQMDIEIKRQKATYVIDNSQDINYLQDEYVKVRDKILSTFKETL